MSVTRIRIVTNPDGSLSLHSRPGKDREGLSPDEQALSERFDRLADVYRSGLLKNYVEDYVQNPVAQAYEALSVSA